MNVDVALHAVFVRGHARPELALTVLSRNLKRSEVTPQNRNKIVRQLVRVETREIRRWLVRQAHYRGDRDFRVTTTVPLLRQMNCVLTDLDEKLRSRRNALNALHCLTEELRVAKILD